MRQDFGSRISRFAEELQVHCPRRCRSGEQIEDHMIESLLLNEEAERKLLPFCGPLLRDIIVLLRDTGMRPKKELFPMRIENLDWNNRVILFPTARPLRDVATFP